ncbi:MAG: ATP synthase F1 subunit delta [Candidatus Marinimicrobia bacterium]|nr:ATP synthase F1 subunit delta [Candidatus Neomarinimicrobiota bacterium]MBL7022540.1 ATP synthase F1 subunit delta [Candidatus Neomarinimicrobiota bacterium]MBL7108896.1 ATP synthase F1 subunit delta [Candidatus Neomarinimicrobiota bacterium]
MKNQRAIRKYSRAVYSVASKSEQIRETENRLLAIMEIYKTSPEFRQFLFTKRVKTLEKMKILQKVLSNSVTELELNLLQILLENSHIDALSDVVKRFIRIAETKSDFAKVTVFSSHKLNEEELSDIVNQLEKKLSRKVYTKLEIDPTLLGGVKLRIGNTIVDGSLARRLENLKSALLRA